MKAYSDTFKLLGKSLFSNDILILLVAVCTAFFLIATLATAKAVEGRTKDWKKKRNPKFSHYLCHSLNKLYTLFVTLISIFPLLGMLGTVFGLLGLDLTAGDMNNIRDNFFIALTSTAWGIIFSVIFKVIHAWFADYIEEQIELSKKLTDEFESKGV